MRAAAIALLMLAPVLLGDAAAADWTRYENARFGFVVDVPPGFQAGGASSGDKQVFTSVDGTPVLTIHGGSVLPGSFDDAWKATQQSYREAGWHLSYEPVAPNWTSFTGVRDESGLYVKMIPLCGGTREFALVALEYPREDAAALDPVITRLASSFKAAGTGFSC